MALWVICLMPSLFVFDFSFTVVLDKLDTLNRCCVAPYAFARNSHNADNRIAYSSDKLLEHSAGNKTAITARAGHIIISSRRQQDRVAVTWRPCDRHAMWR